MASDFESVKAKIKRASEHLAVFHDEAMAYSNVDQTSKSLLIETDRRCEFDLA